MNRRERVLRAIKFENPDVVPLSGGFSPATWHKYRDELVPLAKRLLPDFQREFWSPKNYDEFPPAYRAGEVFTDSWGCVWECKVNGMEGIIKKHPLDDRASFKNYKAPDPLKVHERGPRDFEALKKEAARPRDFFLFGPGERFWERLHFVRGFENTMMDLATNEPNIKKLLNLILDHNMRLIEEVVKINFDIVGFGDDWGDQHRLMVSPEMWREWFKEPYKKMFMACRDAGKDVFFHTDGHLLPVINDLVECGASIVNVQSRPNGIDEIAKLCRKKVCVAIDMDRQYIFPFASPAKLKEYVRECVDKLSWNGGVIVHYDIYPDVPLKNIEAFAEVMEEMRGIKS